MKVWPQAGATPTSRTVLCGQVGGRAVSNTRWWNDLLLLPLALPRLFRDNRHHSSSLLKPPGWGSCGSSVLTTGASSFHSGDSIGLSNQCAEFRDLKAGAKTSSDFTEDDTQVAKEGRRNLFMLCPFSTLPPLPL